MILDCNNSQSELCLNKYHNKEHHSCLDCCAWCLNLDSCSVACIEAVSNLNGGENE